MGKYIDADKLIAEIERYKQAAAIARFDNAGENADYFQGKVDLFDDLTHIITSLQQEQPKGLHFTPLNRLIQKIPSKNWNDTVNNYAKKLRDCLIKEGYLKDAKVLQDYISYMNGNNVPMATMDEQEQPEVDLEKFDKEVTKIWGKCAADPDDSLACFHIETFNEIARHFYGLRNRALEEAARHVYESWMGGTMDDVRRDMVELGKVLNAREK